LPSDAKGRASIWRPLDRLVSVMQNTRVGGEMNRRNN
jgi:hypothetical protein